MRHSQVIDNIKEVAKKVLSKGSALYLYGSRARGDYHEGSDWDLLLLLDKPSASSTRYARIGKSWKNSYPILAKRIPSLVSVTFTFHF
ncbi:MAG: nucleotidyltransferase domain-containing protein [Bacteroidaceae bacterium]|nr:nucleotidyltransferase domain-containing protein [Bacteroidaceae bacterium]